MPAFDLTECLERVRREDPRSARALVEHLYPLVVRIVRSHLPLRMLEEDMTQEVFLKLFSRLSQYKERDGIPFEHWMARLTVRTCLDRLRAEKRRPESRWADLPQQEAACLEYMLSAQDAPPEVSPVAAREVLDLLLDRLRPADRLVIRLLDLEERSVKEISALTGWSAALVKVRAFRARRKLRDVAARWKKEASYE